MSLLYFSNTLAWILVEVKSVCQCTGKAFLRIWCRFLASRFRLSCVDQCRGCCICSGAVSYTHLTLHSRNHTNNSDSSMEPSNIFFFFFFNFLLVQLSLQLSRGRHHFEISVSNTLVKLGRFVTRYLLRKQFVRFREISERSLSS